MCLVSHGYSEGIVQGKHGPRFLPRNRKGSKEAPRSILKSLRSDPPESPRIPDGLQNSHERRSAAALVIVATVGPAGRLISSGKENREDVF